MDDRLDTGWIDLRLPRKENLRLLDFSGVKNFRDLGGYRTVDGRSIQWKRLYRSGHLNNLTGYDLKRLASLDLDRIIDLRTKQEMDEQPDALPAGTNIFMVAIPLLDRSIQALSDSIQTFLQDDLRLIDPVQFLINANIELAVHHAFQMRRFFQELLSADGRPVLFHCSIGKDRTGYVAAILLRILGVLPDEIMEDYLLSNQQYQATFSWFSLALLRLRRGKRVFEVIKTLLEVRPAYLSVAFDALDREYGSFEGYVRNGLGLTEQEIDRLRRLYLE